MRRPGQDSTRTPSCSATIVNVSIKPGEHNHVIVPVTLPAGNYYLVAVADAIGAIVEASEDDNQRALFVTVQ